MRCRLGCDCAILLTGTFYFLTKYLLAIVERQPYLIIGHHGLNHLGGVPSETVQFGFPYRIVDTATCRAMLSQFHGNQSDIII